MNPADQRVVELVDKWLQSIELHLKYASLTDEAYWQVQPWSRHQRPARWILDLALGRARELKRQIEQRLANGDVGFGEALELMAFLANLVGAQHIERFIPLADPERENAAVLGQTESKLTALSTTTTQTRSLLDPTREMRILPPAAPSPGERGDGSPRPAPATTAAAASRPAAPAPAPSAAAPTAGPRSQQPSATDSRKREQRSATAKHVPSPEPGTVEAQIISDAVRLLKWGRQWHELAGAISRIADRPGVVEVRKCLRTFKSEIEKEAQ